ncbi:unnamed protein product [Porites evermanni]|uniref:Bro-N domain-containing protein n=1 Tax=Porites evermanni TaxID=104178 RepID=A0ABN8T3W5_9CNID|nr:unnamed protein product [Porites evermanni]
MTNMLEKSFKNEDLGIELKSFIDKQQNVWFIGKDVSKILGFKDSVNALKRHVSLENKMIRLIQPKTRVIATLPSFFIKELVLGIESSTYFLVAPSVESVGGLRLIIFLLSMFRLLVILFVPSTWRYFKSVKANGVG